MDLETLLPILMPRAIAWAKATSEWAALNGLALSEPGVLLARSVGVDRPEHIRLAIVPTLPVPDDPLLQQAAAHTGLLGPDSVGITLGYSVIVRHGYQSARLLSHEFRHVHQYEEAGSIDAMLPVYLGQIVEYGYEAAPLEIDARAFERDG